MDIEIIERHADEASLLWTQRDFACRYEHTTFKWLLALDERIEAHLDGLRLAGDAGFALAVKNVAKNADAGSVFAAVVLAVERDELGVIAASVDRAEEEPDLARGIISALGWLSLERAIGILPGFLDSGCPPLLRRIGIAACAAHRHDPGPSLAAAAVDADATLRARAFRAAGELGRLDLKSDLLAGLGDGDDGCRYAAAWSLALLGEASAHETLAAFIELGGDRAREACALAFRRVPLGAGHERIAKMRENPATLRRACEAAGALGDPSAIPWLIDCMRDAKTARVAAAAFSCITGADIEGELAGPSESVGPSDDAGDDVVMLDYEELLPAPSHDALLRHHRRIESQLKRGVRHLRGREPSAAWLAELLGRERQSTRVAAAIELLGQAPRQTLFPLKSRAQRQKALLTTR